jgi:hypothetical protein
VIELPIAEIVGGYVLLTILSPLRAIGCALAGRFVGSRWQGLAVAGAVAVADPLPPWISGLPWHSPITLGAAGLAGLFWWSMGRWLRRR